MKTWIAVINQCEAKIFENDSTQSEGLKFLSKLVNPTAGIPTHEGPVRLMHSVPLEKSANAFAKNVTMHLNQERLRHSFDDLVLIVEPGYLGILRENISRDLDKVIIRTIPKDLKMATLQEIEKRVKAVSAAENTEIQLHQS
jgi:protein required for attachment to host cells